MVVMFPGILLPWVASGLVAGSVVIVIILCVCRGGREKILDHGVPGVVHSIDVDKPLLEKPAEQNARNTLPPEESAYEKSKTVTERALPDIPRVLQAGNSITDTDTDHTPDSGSECYATVNKPVENVASTEIRFEQLRNGRLPSNRFSEPVENAISENVGSTSENHTYAQVSKHNKTDRRHTVLCASIIPVEMDCQPSSSATVSVTLPEQEFVGLPSSLHSFEEREIETSSPEPIFGTAGQAVAGNVPSAEIPYMTPPPVVENILLQSEDSQSPYTTISVREPLDRVKKQTVRQQLRQLANRNPSVGEQEGLYTEVPDDQTYAEIDSGQTSAESSTTYDQIEPRIQDFPPDPPTVESLKTVAQAHSRQASIASVSSSGSGNESSTIGRDLAALYSVVDKTGKQRQTIHITENINMHYPHPTEEGPKKIEDMYAKICKKKTSSSAQGGGENASSGTDDVFASSRSSWSPGSSRTRSPPLPPPPLPVGHRLQVTLETDDAQKLVRRHSADPSYIENNTFTDEPEQGYATVGQKEDGEDSSSYEKLPLDLDDPDEPGYERIGHLQGEKSDKSSSDPGYEQIKKLDRYDSDPGYERVRRMKRDTENDPDYDYIPNLSRTDSESGEPGYEKVPSSRRFDSESAEPGYEKVPSLRRYDSESGEPGYEKVPSSRRFDSESAEPGYEKVPSLRRYDSESGEPGYEKVPSSRRFDSESAEPGYEKVPSLRRYDSESGEPGYEKVPSSRRFHSESAEPGYEKVPSLRRYDSDAADPGYEKVKLKQTENGQVSRVSIKVDGSYVVQSADTPAPEIPSCSKDFEVEDDAYDSSDVITVSQCPEKISICINFKPINETKDQTKQRFGIEGANGDAWDGDRPAHGSKFEDAQNTQSNSVSSGDDRSSCTATQNSTGYETASSGESISSLGVTKKRTVRVSSKTEEVTVSNSQGNMHQLSQQTEENVWEGGQQVYQQANYSIQMSHKL